MAIHDDWQPRAGEMHPVDQAFYDLTVKERDYERVKCDRLEAALREIAAWDGSRTLGYEGPRAVARRALGLA